MLAPQSPKPRGETNMARLLDVEMAILKATQKSKIGIIALIEKRGDYLRQLAHGVLAGNYPVGSAALLLLNY